MSTIKTHSSTKSFIDRMKNNYVFTKAASTVVSDEDDDAKTVKLSKPIVF